MISPKKIQFNGYTSTDYDLICDCAFDSSNGGESSFLSREAVSTESYNGKFKRITNYKYNETFSPQITFLKEGFGDFTQDDLRKVLKWLTSTDGTAAIDFYDDVNSEAIVFSCIGNFSDIQIYKLANNRAVGIVATIDSCTPYALSPIRTITKTVDAPAEFTINVETDDSQGVIYPKVTIKQNPTNYVVQADANIIKDFAVNNIVPAEYIPGTVYLYDNVYYYVDGSGVMKREPSPPSGWSTTSVVIQNLTTGTKSLIAMNISGEIITLDGANKIVSSNRATNRVFGNDFNWKWLPLVEGENKIKVTGNCTVTFEYREIIKVGDFV
jgi:hypothetical protein